MINRISNLLFAEWWVAYEGASHPAEAMSLTLIVSMRAPGARIESIRLELRADQITSAQCHT
jgi:hypothetical protein